MVDVSADSGLDDDSSDDELPTDMSWGDAEPNPNHIFTYVERNDRSKLAQLLLQGVSPDHVIQQPAAGYRDNIKFPVGYTALHIAVSRGFPEVAETLISAGANVNAKTRASGTPLHLAATSNYKQDVTNQRGVLLPTDELSAGVRKCIELLIENGADTSAKDMRGAQAWEYSDQDDVRLLLGGYTKEDDPKLGKCVPCGQSSSLWAVNQPGFITSAWTLQSNE